MKIMLENMSIITYSDIDHIICRKDGELHTATLAPIVGEERVIFQTKHPELFIFVMYEMLTAIDNGYSIFDIRDCTRDFTKKF